MRFDIDGFFSLLYELLKDKTPVAKGFAQVVDFCERANPHPDWTRLRQQDFSGDLDHLEQWLRKVFAVDPPEPEITGFWFGLFNPYRNDLPSADLYIAGNIYDANDPEWPVGPRWMPKHRYSESGVMDRIYRIGYDDREHGLMNEAEYPLCLAYGVLAVPHIIRRIGPTLLLGGLKQRVVLLGFDSGDRVLLGMVKRAGFVVSASKSVFRER